MSVHPEPSPLAGKMVRVAKGRLAGSEILIEDWWDRVVGRSWMVCDGNPACLDYAMGDVGSPIDNEVLYGKVGSSGRLVHVTYVEVPTA